MMKKIMIFAVASLMTAMLAFPAYATSFDPSPSRPDIPVVDELPDPEDPDSPEAVTVIENGVPKTYYKAQNPYGIYVYILIEEVPLKGLTSPQTSDNSEPVALATAAAAGLGAVILLTEGKKKKA